MKKMDEGGERANLRLQHVSTNTTQTTPVQHDSVQIHGKEKEEEKEEEEEEEEEHQYNLFNVLKRKMKEKQLAQQYKEMQKHFKEQLCSDSHAPQHAFEHHPGEPVEGNDVLYSSLKLHVNPSSVVSCYDSRADDVDNNKKHINYNGEQVQTKINSHDKHFNVVNGLKGDDEKDEDDKENDEKDEDEEDDDEKSMKYSLKDIKSCSEDTKGYFVIWVK